jgi:hypothetical protein
MWTSSTLECEIREVVQAFRPANEADLKVRTTFRSIRQRVLGLAAAQGGLPAGDATKDRGSAQAMLSEPAL